MFVYLCCKVHQAKMSDKEAGRETSSSQSDHEELSAGDKEKEEEHGEDKQEHPEEERRVSS